VVRIDRLEVNLEHDWEDLPGQTLLKEQNFHITGRERKNLGETRYRDQRRLLYHCDANVPLGNAPVKELDARSKGLELQRACLLC